MNVNAIRLSLKLRKMVENKYEVIIPERRYIVIGLEEVKIILNKYKLEGVCVKLIEKIE